MTFAVPDNKLVVLIECTGFAYSKTLERLNTVAPDRVSSSPAMSTEPAWVVSTVIVPLLKQSQYSAFHPIVRDTRTALDTGKFQSIREVELFLLADSPVSRFCFVIFA